MKPLNQYMQLLKHDLNHATIDQALNSLRVVIGSIACHNEGKALTALVTLAKQVNYDETMVVGAIVASLGEEEYNRMKTVWNKCKEENKDG